MYLHKIWLNLQKPRWLESLTSLSFWSTHSVTPLTSIIVEPPDVTDTFSLSVNLACLSRKPCSNFFRITTTLPSQTSDHDLHEQRAASVLAVAERYSHE